MEKEVLLLNLKQICRADTSADTTGWTVVNPLWGHCAVVAVLAQDYFGGRIMRGSLQNNAKYSYLRSHYWNELPSGEQIDFTAEQYPDLQYSELQPEERSREQILSYPETMNRYNLLKSRLESKEI